MIRPFVEGYWAWAASSMKDVPTFSRELDACVKLSQMTNSFMELYRPENGQADGSPRQLWSGSGFLSMIYHGLFGMTFEENGVSFAPVVPERFAQLSLSNVKYRNATLRVTVKGHGTDIKQFSLDGKKARKAFFSAELTGAHEVEILVK
jgi:cellobiose phosphorylase